MSPSQKQQLKELILKRNELYEMQNSRLKRFLKDPVRTLMFYIMQTIGYVHPYKVDYTTLWGSKMSFYLPEGGMIYYYGFWEANLTNFLVNFLKEGDVFFDVGAHVGYYSILASDLVSKEGHVYSFEPTPRTFASLYKNADHKKNISVYNNAILNNETTIDFFDYGPKYSAFNTFEKRTGEEIFFKEDVLRISVKTISLDDFCKKNSITPTFIKIDAEGSEYLILGAMDYILKELLPIVSIEVSSNKEWEHNLVESFKTFEEHGYVSYEITTDGRLNRCNPKEMRTYDNLIFVHTSTIPRIKEFIV